MEQKISAKQVLDQLCLQAEGSPILPIVAPLFETLNHQSDYYPNRVSEDGNYTQLFWNRGELRSGEFEAICLTLSRETLSLTVALDHRHGSRQSDIPVIPRPGLETPSRSSMYIDAYSHTLYETNPINAVLLGRHYEQEAITRFTPELTHALAILGLYGYGQAEQREVS